MRMRPHEIAIGILADEFDSAQFPNPEKGFAGKDDAAQFLNELTGEDFGKDLERWREWFAGRDQSQIRHLYDRLGDR